MISDLTKAMISWVLGSITLRKRYPSVVVAMSVSSSVRVRSTLLSWRLGGEGSVLVRIFCMQCW